MADVDMKGWSPEQKAAYEAAMAELAHEEERLAEVKATEEAKKTAPEAVIASKKAELSAKRAERERVEREAAEDAIWAELVANHGEKHVARIRTVEGSIMIRGNTAKEIEATSIRLDAAKSDIDRVKIANNALRATVLHPSLERFDKLVESYPGLWSALYAPRDVLNRGLEEEREGKG
ncbi:MAG: hypothetical protein QM820_47115 [Minicystis sp.]